MFFIAKKCFCVIVVHMTDATFKFSNDLSLFTGVILPQTATHGAFPEQKKEMVSFPTSAKDEPELHVL